MELKKPEQIADSIFNAERFAWASGEPDRTRTLVVAAIEADRAQIAQALAEKSHPDDWGVPCVYVENFSKTHLGIEIEVAR